MEIRGEGLGNSLNVSGGTFTTKGKTYEARSLNCSMTDGNAAITAVFTFLTEFDNVSMTLDINGEKMTFDLEDFFNNAGISQVSDSGLGNMKIYLDGKEIILIDMQEIASDQIASMTVDKKENVVYITIKNTAKN